MIDAFSSLFSRNFIFAHLLPSVYLFTVVSILFRIFDFDYPSWLTESNPFFGTTIISIVIAISSVFLSFFKYSLFRIYEGYPFFRSRNFFFDIFKHSEKKRLRAIRRKIARLIKERDKLKEIISGIEEKIERLGDDHPQSLTANLYLPQYKIELSRTIRAIDKLRFRRAQEFRFRTNQNDIQNLSDEDAVLPTSFGNAISSFEDYPRVLYGIESIQGWSRLLAVIDEEFIKKLATRRSETDFWLNIWFSCSLSIYVIYFFACLKIDFNNLYPSLVYVTVTYSSPVLCLVASILLVEVTAMNRAKAAAVQWGEMVKAAFDIYLPELAAKLGYSIPEDPDKAHEFWVKFSQAIVYKSRSSYIATLEYKSKASDDHTSNDVP